MGQRYEAMLRSETRREFWFYSRGRKSLQLSLQSIRIFLVAKIASLRRVWYRWMVGTVARSTAAHRRNDFYLAAVLLGAMRPRCPQTADCGRAIGDATSPTTGQMMSVPSNSPEMRLNCALMVREL
ncbi:hypothetical protein RMSM_06320 [Rhodopirellula maiorica SM1]|uniref:Uncharacterized protein n=1 Tax=Rhodopirellula maiorica SM1 TaxID=1265738 RepID=M5RCG8_9BACT|nr:hypothetical protein RMSM_06320 [Rhodopirellula maiorica SM1]